MKLSENQEHVQELKRILESYPDLEYDEHSSARMDNMLIIKVSSNAGCDISTAVDIARKLSKSTGDEYKVQPRSGSNGSLLNNLKSFGLFLLTPNRNVRITYPNSKDGKLEIDIIEGMEMSLNLNDPHIWSFAEENELEIHFNIFADPNYRKFLRTHITKFTRNYNESPDVNHFSNSELKQTVDDDTDLSKNSLD